MSEKVPENDEAADVPGRSESGTSRVSGGSLGDQTNPEAQRTSPKEFEGFASDGKSDSENAIPEQSCIDIDPRGSSNRDECPDGSTEGFSEVVEQKAVGKDTPLEVQRGSDRVLNVGSEKTAYFIVHDNSDLRGQLEVGIEGRTSPLAAGGQCDFPKEDGGHGGSNFRGNDGLTTSSSDPEESSESSALLLPIARKKGGSIVQSRGVTPKIRKDGRSPVMKYLKSVTNRGRDIFEAGGDESLNPRLKRHGRIMQSGSDVIEPLPRVEEEPSPEPQVFITPSTTPEDQRVSGSCVYSSLDVPIVLGCNCCSFWLQKLEGQFMKAPLFYVMATIVTFFAVATFTITGQDMDIFACLLGTLSACIFITVAVPRGWWAKDGEKLEYTGFCGLFQRDPKNPGLCSSCRTSNKPPKPQTLRHSQYFRLREDADTTFEHEVADVSNIDPKDCPQIKMVEDQDIESPGSPNLPPEIHELKVDVHPPRTLEGPEVATLKKSSKSRLKSSCYPTKSPDPRTGSPAGGDESVSGAPEGVLKSTLRSLLAETDAYDVESGRGSEEFVCEHDGQGVACSCFSERHGKNI